MSFMLYAYLLEKYGPRLTIPQLAEVLQRGKRGLANEICRPEFPIRSYIDAGQRFVDIRDVVEHLDRLRTRDEGSYSASDEPKSDGRKRGQLVQ